MVSTLLNARYKDRNLLRPSDPWKFSSHEYYTNASDDDPSQLGGWFRYAIGGATHDVEVQHSLEWISGFPASVEWRVHPSPSRGATTDRTDNLRERLANANDYFRRKASEVLNDEPALRLLVAMYQDVVVDISSFDSCENGIPLAKLTAANFCEVGAKVIYITQVGQQFIDSIKEA